MDSHAKIAEPLKSPNQDALFPPSPALDGSSQEIEVLTQLALNPTDTKLLLRAGELRFASGDLLAAKCYFEQVFSIDADVWEACFYLGTIAYRTGKMEHAQSLLGRAALLNPSCSAIFLAIGHLHRHSAEFEAALRNYDKAAALSPRSTAVHLSRARLLEMIGDTAGSLQACSAAVEIAPRDSAVRTEVGCCLLGANRKEEALRSFAAALQYGGHSAKALFNFGYTAALCGKFKEALIPLTNALSLEPEWSDVRMVLGSVKAMLGDADGARAEVKEIERLAPHLLRERNVPKELLPFIPGANLQSAGEEAACLQRAQLELRAGRHSAAVTLLEEAMQRLGRTEKLLLSLAHAKNGAGLRDDALLICKEITTAHPNCADAHALMADILLRSGRAADAVAAAQQSVRLNPANAASHVLLAKCWNSCAKRELAEQALRMALRIEPNSVNANFELGKIALESSMPHRGEPYLRKVVQLAPEWPLGHAFLARALRDQNRLDQAMYELNIAIQMEPHNLGHLITAAHISSHAGEAERAVEYYERALAVDPQNYEALAGLGTVLGGLHRFKESEEYFQRALALRPHDGLARWNRALRLLLEGNYAEGWREFEARMLDPAKQRHTDKPYWDGSDPNGKTIFVYLEQGMGDCIHCIRYLPMLRDRGAKVIVESRHSLQRLLETIPGIMVLRQYCYPLHFDFHLSIMSLPHLMGTTMENVPNEVPYFFLKTSAPVLPQNGKPKVGIVWRGNPKPDKRRSSSLEDYGHFLSIPGVEFYALQKELNEDERCTLAELPHVTNLGAGFKDFYDTAEVIQELDLVITIDTSVAHLAGALGKETWVVLCAVNHWQWLLERVDSPWYPTMRLFRQRTLGDWGPVMAEVRTALAQKFSKRLPESFLPDEAAILARAYLDDGNLPAAKKLMETGSTTIKQSELQHLKALLAASYGEWKNAITEINHALLHEPGNPVLLNDLGIFEWNAGELDRAERAFSKALSAAPQLEEPALNLALLLTELDRPQDAHQLLTSLPESAKSHGVNLLLGDIEEKRGGFVAAENHFQKALSLMPQITAPYIRLARLAANRGNLEKAYESYAQALALDPDDAELRAELAKMLCHFGMITEAVGQLEAASRSLPANTDIKLMLAEAMEKLGNKNPAIETIYSALQQQPLNAGLHIFLSRAQYNAGRLSDAVASAAQAALLEPDSREALHLYSELSGIQKDAIEILRKRKRGESQ